MAEQESMILIRKLLAFSYARSSQIILICLRKTLAILSVYESSLSQSRRQRYTEIGGSSQGKSSLNGEIHFLELGSQTSQIMLATLSRTLNHQSGCPDSSAVIGDITQGRFGSVGQSLLLTNEPFFIENESG